MTTIGNARINEKGTATGGAAGDQTGKEVMLQAFYMPTAGYWEVIRPKSDTVATKIAAAMVTACNNDNIGYDWDTTKRQGVYKYGTSSTVKTYCDCSSLVCQCAREATGATIANFATGTEKSVLVNSGYFTYVGRYTNSNKITLYTGDVLLTSGHTAIVTSGTSRGAGGASSGTTSTTTSTTSSSSFGDTRYWGPKITKAMQKALGTTQDGIVSGQPMSNKKYLPNCETDSWKFVNGKASGSQMAKALQKKIGATADGYFGKGSVTALQKYLNKKIGAGLSVDGSMGPATVQAVCKGLEKGIF